MYVDNYIGIYNRNYYIDCDNGGYVDNIIYKNEIFKIISSGDAVIFNVKLDCNNTI